jgi:signal transduction histidine kinase/CheY-like chemotaxis protein
MTGMIKILAIDDNKDNLSVLKTLLSDAFPGASVITTTSGREGIKRAKSENPDVILLDLVMPEMDGFEICRRLKEDELLKIVPVIILTVAEVDAEVRVRALNLGVKTFLSKPVDGAELIALVTAMIRIKQSETTIRQENIRLEELVKERTEDLQNQLEEKRETELRLQRSFYELENSKLATLNLLEDIKSEMDQRKKAEDSIRQLNAMLERRVMERTSQLEDTNRELEAFAYSVSHDLRAPLRAIDGFSRFVLEDYGTKLDPQGQRLIGLIRTNTQKMDQLITDILALSRVTRSEHNISEVDMRKMAISMYNECTSTDVKNKPDISIDNMPDALGDPTYLKQVWTNLISNAIKFSSGKEKPEIKIGGYNEQGFHVYFVRDNGVGFNPEYAYRLFNAFQRLHKTDEFEGTGVGLAIVQRIVHRHGGKVWAEGKEGEGATFYFSLPIKI